MAVDPNGTVRPCRLKNRKPVHARPSPDRLRGHRREGSGFVNGQQR
jgi:hypothetical protein